MTSGLRCFKELDSTNPQQIWHPEAVEIADALVVVVVVADLVVAD